jgi:membrane protein YdbS with pleckstrin-like domain
MPVITCPDCGRDVSTLAAACPHCGRPSPAGFAPIGAPAVGTPAMVEETLWRGSPSWRVLLAKVVVMILTAIIIPIAASFISSHTADIEMSGRIMKFSWWITAILLLYQVVVFLIALFRLQSTLYTITSQRVMFEQGILSKSLNEIDLRSIDDTQFFQSFMDRLLGIGNVSLVSSDKALPMTMLRGVHDPRKLRELIRSRAYQVSQRQVFTRAT